MEEDASPSLPGLPLDALEPPGRPWLQDFGGLARRAVYHLLNPMVREPCLEGAAPPPLARVYYEVAGWQVPLRVLEPAPGGPGEPVLLAHALGLHGDAWRLGGRVSLASTLSRAGFRVYLLAHRGDRDAVHPTGGASFDFDHLLREDVPAALAAVRSHSGSARVHWVGHGLGGQLGLAHAARDRDLASVVAICAPARFPAAPRSEARRIALAARLLPAGWQIPSRSVAWASVPWVDERQSLLGQVQPGTIEGPRLRSLLTWGTDDLPVGLLRQVHRWQRSGVWSDRTGCIDYAETLVDARGPALVLAAGGDALCPPDSALWAAERWGGHAERLRLADTYGHLDPILARSASDAVFRPIARWLSALRRRAWVAA